jgi:hypothetical protein
MTWDEFQSRAKRLPPQYTPHSGAYEVITPEGQRGWTALSEVWDDSDRGSTLIRKMYPTPKTLYATEREAVTVSLIGALKWAEEGLPTLPDPLGLG